MQHNMFNMTGKSGSTKIETPSMLRKHPGIWVSKPSKQSSTEQSNASGSSRNQLVF